MPDHLLTIGLDVGGSSTELLARSSNGADEVYLKGPGANVQRAGTEASAQIAADLIQQALQQHPQAKLASVCAGMAGAGRPEDQDAIVGHFRRLLAEHLSTKPPVCIRVVHDALIALEAAFKGGSGLIIIAGTGSAILGRTASGALERAGGWGYLLGDEGSGYDLGLAGLRAVADAFDGGPVTRLKAQLADRHGIDSRDGLIRRVYREEWPVQNAAPLVVEAAAAGDAVAQSIIDTETDALSRQVEWLLNRGNDIEPRIALLGGLVQEDFYANALSEALQRRLPGWTIRKLKRRPVEGALHLLADVLQNLWARHMRESRTSAYLGVTKHTHLFATLTRFARSTPVNRLLRSQVQR